MTTFHTLASSSAGNCMLLSCGDTHILIDAGISCRRISQSLCQLGLSLADLSAVLITHEHSDHTAGLKTLLKGRHLPLYTSPGTAWALSCQLPQSAADIHPLSVGAAFRLGPCRVTPFPTRHDAVESVGYRIDTEDGAVGILTDSGCIPAAAPQLLQGVELLVLESNYDEAMLLGGTYPEYLKQRILGQRGHLSNHMAADFAAEMARCGTTAVWLAHLSKENNCPAVAEETVSRRLQQQGLAPELYIAPRSEVSKEFQLCRRSLSFASEN